MKEIKVKAPMVIKGALEDGMFQALRNEVEAFYLDSTMDRFEPGFGRYQLNESALLTMAHQTLVTKAKQMFESETLQPSWYQLGVYEGPKAQLHHHKDDNACQYTIDLCILQKTMWPIWVEGVEYKLEENDALFMYGNDQEHWREPFPDPMNNVVGNAFFFYCEPDHWYFTEGPQYLDVIRANKATGMM